jgi:hypothetical protein
MKFTRECTLEHFVSLCAIKSYRGSCPISVNIFGRPQKNIKQTRRCKYGSDTENRLSYFVGYKKPSRQIPSDIIGIRRSQWPRGLSRTFSAARLLRFWVRIPPGAWMFVCCERCVLSGKGLCNGLITHPEESYRLWRVVVCDQETSNTRRLKPATEL